LRDVHRLRLGLRLLVGSASRLALAFLAAPREQGKRGQENGTAPRLHA
jgi:hypothetical protein